MLICDKMQTIMAPFPLSIQPCASNSWFFLIKTVFCCNDSTLEKELFEEIIKIIMSYMPVKKVCKLLTIAERCFCNGKRVQKQVQQKSNSTSLFFTMVWSHSIFFGS